MIDRMPQLATTRLYCPVAEQTVTVEFLTYDGIHPVSVVSCTGFADPGAITCGMPCLHDERRPLTKGEAPRG